MTNSRKLIGLAALLCLVLAAGCAKDNAIKLTYALGPTASPCAGDVVIFKFEDKRPTQTLGTDGDGMPITVLSDVSDWVGWALYDELAAAGCHPKYRTATVPQNGETVITGEVLAVTLNSTGATTYAGKVSVKITISRNGELVHVEKFTSEVEDVAITGYGSRTEILAEALRGLMAEAVPAIATSL